MRKENNNQLVYAATDLSSHLACRHLTALNLDVARGRRDAPDYRDPSLKALQERGQEFEVQYLAHLKANGWDVDDEPVGEDHDAQERTVAAMRAGRGVIYQAVLSDGRRYGRIDFLRRVEKPCNLGEWSYEVVDTKLAKETRAGTVLQLCLYAELVEAVQGRMPEYIHVVTPEEGLTELTYRVADFIYYYRTVVADFEAAIHEPASAAPHTYPVPVAHCDICRWWHVCDSQRRSDDHLSLVAGLSNTHTKEINQWGLSTLTAFAQHRQALPKPSRGAVETYSRLQEQARVQILTREQGQVVYDILPTAEGKGLACLPEPSQGDVFFDFEGDSYVGTDGIEYLFGFIEHQSGEYTAKWAFTAEEEKRAFEQFIDAMMERWEQYPDFHIYHYTPYEPGAIKRLMGRYGTREEEVDRLLRGQRFVDLYQVVRQSLRVGVERYSLKELEPVIGFTRQLSLMEAAASKRTLESLLERGGNPATLPEVRQAVQDYNKDDCASTRQLREFLEHIRQQCIAKGQEIPRPSIPEDQPSEHIREHLARIQPLMDSLLDGVPADPTQRSAEQQANYLLAHMLDWYRREDKSFWWEYFRLQELAEDEYVDEKAAIWGLRYTGERRKEKRSFVDTYHFPSQECDIRAGEKVNLPDGRKLGDVLRVDYEAGIIAIKKRGDTVDIHPRSVLKQVARFNATEKEEAIIRLAQWVVSQGIDADGDYRAGRDLLLRRAPRTLHPFTSEAQPQERAIAWAQALDAGVLPVQGPPGTGKSHTAAKMMLSFIRAGKKIGVTAMSHKVIENLMEKVYRMAESEGVSLQGAKKMSSNDAKDAETPYYLPLWSNNDALAAIQNPAIHVVAGTPFLWAREEFRDAVDVLFVDEAGQLSLIDTLAVSQAARNLVLLGDPQQLQQPQQGSHPEGTEVSALSHVLGNAHTIPPDKGVLLDVTWRMHPAISSFVSELFYDGQLTSKGDLRYQSITFDSKVTGSRRLNGSGLRLCLTDHTANRHASMEEVDVISAMVDELLQYGVSYCNPHQEMMQVTPADILVIAPYNAQVALLKEHLPDGVAVGTVDKFQGQEAPVVIFSVTTSSPEDAPRGMDFLYSGNRLNVAVSRARALFVMVANRPLFAPECNSVPQMRLANAFCSYMANAERIP